MLYCQFHWECPTRFFKIIKAKFQNPKRMRAEEAGTSPAGAVVSNRENRRGIIKAFIVPSRSF